METRIVEIAERIKGLREMMDITPEEMAEAAGVELEEYLKHENGEQDFGFTFLYKCADKLDVDIVELLTGENPRLSFYSIVRKGEGLDIKRRAGFKYEHLNYRFKNKFDFIISGQLKTRMEDHVEILKPGDAIYYDSGRGHGMIAAGGEPCTFLAIVMRRVEEEAEDHENA